MTEIKLPEVKLSAHKNTRGHALIVAGSKEKSGAAILSSLACMRTGVGLATLALPSAAHTIIKSQLINIMSEEIPSDEHSQFDSSGIEKLISVTKGKTAVLMGPGLAPDKNRKKWVEKILSAIQVPFVLDAQALSDLGTQITEINWSKHAAVITPHEGEMSKLTGLTSDQIHSDRENIAKTYALKWNLHVILKGHHTVIASPSGETWINTVDHPCLSVAGTGDVLAGILVSLLAQGMAMTSACRVATYIHGSCGVRLGEKVGIRGVVASDLINEIPQVIRDLDKTNQS